MQATTRMKRFTLTHMVTMTLTLSLVASAVTAVTTLAITGDLPGQQPDAASAPPSAPTAREDAERRQLEMELNDFHEFMGRNNDAERTNTRERIDAYIAGDYSALDLDQHGADVIPAAESDAADIPDLDLDRNGADVP